MNNGNVNNNNKNNTTRVRAVAPVPAASATPQVVYDIPFSSVIQAWIDCERNKKSSNSCTKFRWHAARDLVALWKSMCSGEYKPNASMVFMVMYPVLREVWAGAFRDRTVHHWEALRFGPVIEKYFVDVGDVSMNCRKGYGSLRAIQTFQKYIYDYTEGYTRQDCWIVGGDFANFFMSIDKEILWEALEQLIMDEYTGEDKSQLLYMMHKTLFHKPQENYYRHSPIELWEGLPDRKSLFHMDGLAIGNLPSQLWANLMGAIFTDWVIHVKKVECFLIFVDDWRCLVRSAEEGRELIAEFKKFLQDQLHITLHPNKVYLQHYTKGTKMVGAVIKPKRVYISNRTRGHFIEAMKKHNAAALATNHAGRMAMLEKVRATINSYLGMMVHFNSYKIRRRICMELIVPVWGEYMYFEEGFMKCKIKARYDKLWVVRKKLKRHNYAAKFIRPKWRPTEEEDNQ